MHWAVSDHERSNASTATTPIAPPAGVFLRHPSPSARGRAPLCPFVIRAPRHFAGLSGVRQLTVIIRCQHASNLLLDSIPILFLPSTRRCVGGSKVPIPILSHPISSIECARGATRHLDSRAPHNYTSAPLPREASSHRKHASLLWSDCVCLGIAVKP